MSDLGISSGGDALSHLLDLGGNTGGDFTPDAILDAIGRMNDQVVSLAREIFNAPDAGIYVAPIYVTSWDDFTQRWAAFKSDSSSYISRAWNSTRDRLLAFAKEFNAYVDTWKTSFAPSTVVQNVNVAPPDPGALKPVVDWFAQFGVAIESIGKGVALVGAVALGAYIASKVSK